MTVPTDAPLEERLTPDERALLEAAVANAKYSEGCMRADLDAIEAEREALREAIQSFHDEHHGRGGGPFSKPDPISLNECSDPRCRALLSSSPAAEGEKG